MDFTTSPFKFSNFVKAMDDITHPDSWANTYEKKIQATKSAQELWTLFHTINKDTKLKQTSKEQLIINLKHRAKTHFNTNM